MNNGQDGEIDGARILEDARAIAFPRYPGTEGDRKAIGIVAGKLRDAGLETREEEFTYDIRPAFGAIRALLIASAVLVAAAGALASRSALLALLLLLAGAVVGGILLVWAPGAERIYRRPGPTRTANVVGRRRAADPRMTLVLLAHHDSKSQNLTFPVRMGMTLTAILGGIGLCLVLLAMLLHGYLPGWLPALAGGLPAAALLVLSTLRSGNNSPGGVDNAGSVGIVLELARILPREVPEDVELIFLSPGAEEDHMVGAMRWLDAHRDDLDGRPVYALNFDGAGAPGKAVLLEWYGFGKPFSPRLSATARDSARRLGIALRRVWMPPAMGVDAIPFAHRGVNCLTFSSGSLDRATIAVHSSGDVADNLDQETLARVARLGRDVALSLARR